LTGGDSASGSVVSGAAAGGSQSVRRGPAAGWLAGAVFAVLVVASFAAFGVTQRLKHTPTTVQNFERTTAFYPTRVAAAGCHGRVPRRLVEASKRIEYVSFKLARADTVTVAVVNAAGGEEATLVRDLPVERYKQVSLCWNGQRGPRQRGGLAPRGEYRLRVSLSSLDHPVYSPESFALDAGRP
jgi:hypothetical protein